MSTDLDTQDAIKVPNGVIQFLDRSQKRLLQILLNVDLSTILPIDNK
jgi:hypothetical protein